MRKQAKEAAPTMAQYIPRLSTDEMRVICAWVNAKSSRERNIHPGVLPFIPMIEIVQCLRQGMAQHPRYMARLLSKLEDHKWRLEQDQGYATCIWHRGLSDKKVYKWFGPHPERGRGLEAFPLEKRPRERRVFESAADAYDLVRCTVALTKTSKNYWKVSCLERHSNYVDTWLTDNCM